MSASSPIATPLALSMTSMGVVTVCVYFSLIFYGIFAHQSYEYLRSHLAVGHCPFEIIYNSWVKLLIATSRVVATFLSVTHMHVAYYYSVANFFNPSALAYAVWSVQVMPLGSGAQTALTQGACGSFFVRRTWICFVCCGAIRDRNRSVQKLHSFHVGLIPTSHHFTACSVHMIRVRTMAGALSEAASILSSILGPATTQLPQWFASAINGLAVVADVLLTGILIISLYQQRTGFASTDSVLNVVMLYAINTGATAIISPHDLVFIGLGMVGSRLYSITLLAALNARKSLNERMLKTGTIMGPHAYSLHPVVFNPATTASAERSMA
ncbi:hypothetical protein OH77DRAFT_1538007 [Trametes cingulata]|nr:hypothetical protein OH77DRAFT_1538007 [Trametes cingulata]